MNRIIQHRSDVNAHLCNMVKIAKLPPAFRHYGDYRTGILNARKNGNTNLQIAEEIYRVTGKGPLQKLANGLIGLNRERAATFISQVVCHHRAE